MYELEKMWISESTQSCMDMADKSTYWDGKGHICRAFHVEYSTTGHGCRNPNIWLATKASGLQDAGRKVDPGVQLCERKTLSVNEDIDLFF